MIFHQRLQGVPSGLDVVQLRMDQDLTDGSRSYILCKNPDVSRKWIKVGNCNIIGSANYPLPQSGERSPGSGICETGVGSSNMSAALEIDFGI
ncbi:hypothetical protein TEQG_06432 [Trichophyton equinum CBS 127.97]|uniref:Uncharacterized protein n=1 Tax=Trichophyton equinum (strain ATCC MYA-4606 / CBS 127.97) TaxID=559882 RepID=F2Q051_TRIEC|nr:hypothetical protein TEQG_06432 [Trichophyton equinum CBS 127.97]